MAAAAWNPDSVGPGQSAVTVTPVPRRRCGGWDPSSDLRSRGPEGAERYGRGVSPPVLDLDAVRSAVHAAGVGAVASGRTAARLWGLTVPVVAIEVTRQRDAARLPGMVSARRHEIPVVDAVTALLQMTEVLPAPDLVLAAEHLGIDGATLVSRAEHWIARGGPWREQVRALIAAVEAAPRPDSVLESRFLRLLDRAGLRLAASLHHRVSVGSGGSFEVDVAFPDQRVAVELDGWRYHRSERSFRSDRARDVELAAVGWVVLRFTHADVDRRPKWVVDQIRRTCAARAARATPLGDASA